jgi:hypothetical protein
MILSSSGKKSFVEDAQNAFFLGAANRFQVLTEERAVSRPRPFLFAPQGRKHPVRSAAPPRPSLTVYSARFLPSPIPSAGRQISADPRPVPRAMPDPPAAPSRCYPTLRAGACVMPVITVIAVITVTTVTAVTKEKRRAALPSVPSRQRRSHASLPAGPMPRAVWCKAWCKSGGGGRSPLGPMIVVARCGTALHQCTRPRPSLAACRCTLLLRAADEGGGPPVPESESVLARKRSARSRAGCCRWRRRGGTRTWCGTPTGGTPPCGACRRWSSPPPGRPCVRVRACVGRAWDADVCVHCISINYK